MYLVSGGWYHFDYSCFLAPTLNENSLKETTGLGSLTSPDGYGTEWYCPGGSMDAGLAAANIDWNCNGSIQPSAVSADINQDGYKNTLGSQNNWANITFRGNGVIGSSASLAVLAAQALPTTYWVDELTPDMVPPTQPGP